MVERRQNLSFTLKPPEPIRIPRDTGRQHLQRNITLESGIARSIDLAHPTGSDGR
jgi:hypothetical protein